MCLIHYSLPLCLTLPAFSTSFFYCLMAMAGRAVSHNTANEFTVRATSLGWYPSHCELRFVMSLTHHTLEEKRLGQRVYRSPHARCLRGNYPSYFSSVLLYTLSIFPFAVLRSKGVAGAPSGTHLPSIKPIAMEIVCNFRGC